MFPFKFAKGMVKKVHVWPPPKSDLDLAGEELGT